MDHPHDFINLSYIQHPIFQIYLNQRVVNPTASKSFAKIGRTSASVEKVVKVYCEFADF